MSNLITALAVCLITACSIASEPGTANSATQASYRAHMAAATLSYQHREPDEARKWLMGAPVAHRGWEWRLLDNLLDQSTHVLNDFKSEFLSISLQPGGTLAAASMSNGTIALWDTKTRAKREELPGHPGGTFCVRFSPDGSRIASAGADRIARIWDPATGKILREFAEHKFPVTSVAFTADGSRVFTSAYFTDASTPIEGRVHRWRVDTGEIEQTYRGGVKPLSSLALSPDGKLIAAGSWDSCVFIWNVDSAGEPRKLGGKPGPLQNIHINAVAFSPDGSLLAAGSDDKWARVYRVSDGAELVTLRDHAANVNAVGFSGDGKTLATGGDDSAIRLWNVSDWSAKATLCGHASAVRTIGWTPDSKLIYSGSLDRTIRQWDATFPGYGGLRTHYGKNNYAAKFSPDGTLLSCASSDGTIGLIDAATGREAARWETDHSKEVCTSAISPDGKAIASCSWDGRVRIFDLKTHALITELTAPAGIALITWHPDGKRIAAALRDKTAVLFTIADKKIVQTFSGHERAVNSVAFSADGSRLATASGDTTVRVWNTDSGAAITTIKGHTSHIESAVFTPDGASIVSGSADGTVRLWNAATGAQIRQLLGSDDPIHRVAVSPDGRRIAAGGTNLYIFDPGIEGPVMRSSPSIETIWHLDWSPEGERLAIAGWSGSIIIYSTAKK